MERDTLIKDTDLSQRAKNSLAAAEIETVGQLIDISWVELTAYNIGSKTLTEVNDFRRSFPRALTGNDIEQLDAYRKALNGELGKIDKIFEARQATPKEIGEILHANGQLQILISERRWRK